ncbi:unnamed protein product [Calypogeia fissa]
MARSGSLEHTPVRSLQARYVNASFQPPRGLAAPRRQSSTPSRMPSPQSSTPLMLSLATSQGLSVNVVCGPSPIVRGPSPNVARVISPSALRFTSPNAVGATSPSGIRFPSLASARILSVGTPRVVDLQVSPNAAARLPPTSVFCVPSPDVQQPRPTICHGLHMAARRTPSTATRRRQSPTSGATAPDKDHPTEKF